jgi:hypothetical protein
MFSAQDSEAQPWFNTHFSPPRMKWLLLLTILSGYSGSSTVAANFDSKDVCEAAAKSVRAAPGGAVGAG